MRSTLLVVRCSTCTAHTLLLAEHWHADSSFRRVLPLKEKLQAQSTASPHVGHVLAYQQVSQQSQGLYLVSRHDGLSRSDP